MDSSIYTVTKSRSDDESFPAKWEGQSNSDIAFPPVDFLGVLLLHPVRHRFYSGNMDYLAANIAALTSAHPAQAAFLKEKTRGLASAPYQLCGDPPRDALCLNEAGESLRLFDDAQCGLEAESYRIVWSLGDATSSDLPSSLIVVGMGLCESLSSLQARLHPEGRLIVIEPDPRLFLTCLVAIDLRHILADPRILFVTGFEPRRAAEQIGRELQWGRLIHLPHQLLAHESSIRMYPGFFRQFKTCWIESIEREDMYLQKRAGQDRIVTEHTAANLFRILDCPGCVHLFNRFQQCTAILVGAGPSLSDNLEALRAVSGNALIACVNTAYPVLRRAGIAPDIVVCMDHHSRNLCSFESLEHDPRTYLAADPRIEPGIFDHFPNHALLLSWHTTREELGNPAPPQAIPLSRGGGNSLYHWLQKRMGEKGTLTATGSVAVAAYQLLAYMGCEPIVLLGMDLAFPNQKTYAEGTIFGDGNLPRDDRVTHTIPAAGGGEVGTSTTLNLYRLLLEHEIKRFRRQTINCSLGGAQIAETKVLPLYKALAAKCVKTIPRLPDVYAEACMADPYRGKNEALHSILHDLSSQLETLAQASETIISNYESGTQQTEMDVTRLENNLAGLRKEHDSAHFVLNELLQPALISFEQSQWLTLGQPTGKQVKHRERRCLDALKAIAEQARILFYLLDKY